MADRKIARGTNATPTFSVASLASSSTWLGGYETAAIDNTTNKYLDYKCNGKVTVGTTPTAGTEIRLYVVSIWEDGTTWPDVFDGTASTETITSAGVASGFLRLACTMLVDATTSDRAYPFEFSVANLFGGVCPDQFVIFLTHNTGVNLNATGGNHVLNVKGVYETIT